MNNRIFVGSPGSGKTYRAKYEVIRTIWEQMDPDERKTKEARYYNPINFCEEAFNYVEEHYFPQIKLASLHEGMTTSDFIEGISISTEDGANSFVHTDKIVLQLLAEMNATDKPGFLILDDIHRVNLVGVLGELLYAFSHRGDHITLSSGRTISVPENLYVYLTMNTLRPEFPLDPSIFGSFQISYMDSGVDCLKNAVKESYYKSAYYNIAADIINDLIDKQAEYNALIDEVYSAGDNIPQIFEVEHLFDVDMSYCFDDLTAADLLEIEFPVIWDKRADIKTKYRKRYNDIADRFCKKLNEAYEMYSKFCSEKTLGILDGFQRKVEKEYKYYNSYLDHIAPEYHADKQKYQIGYTYFLPGHGFSMWSASELLQNKIRAQVIPLLRQYENEGIIVGCRLPDIERTSTAYTRERCEVGEEKIEIAINDEYRDIFTNLYSGHKTTANIKNPMNKSQPYNPTYGVLFEIVNDMITYPLINTWRLMDLLCRDKEIYFKTDVTHLYEGCLLALSKLSDKIITAGTDNTPGNQSLTSYKRDLHAFYYKGQKYVLLSKIGLDNNVCNKSVETCKLTAPVTSRYHNIYPIVKVLVFEYLRIFKDNLEALLHETIDATAAAAVRADIRMVEQDLDKMDVMEWHGVDADERRWNLIDEVKNLDTWKRMTSGTLKGAYKKMDDRYQSVMNSTGIHQMILQGPPGTSKTYGVKEFLAMQAGLINHKGEKWDDDALNARQLLTGNDEYVLPTKDVPQNNNVYWDIIQFHPSYTYEDFVRGISVSASDSNFTEITGDILEGVNAKYSLKMKQPTPVMYKTVNRTLGKMAKIARDYYNEDNPENSPKFYLVIDEINRANLATVFGELIYALEYRDSEVATPYSVGTDARLRIPSNLYIVGTMNTADKSIASIDYAIRRRFLFFPVLPDIKVVYETVKFDWKSAIELKLFYIIEKMFDSYMNTDDYNRNDVQIGHTYFLRKEEGAAAEDQMKNRFLYQVIPVIREYYNDGILMDDIYGKEPSGYEKDCIQIIKKMTNESDMDKLESMYSDIVAKLSNSDIEVGIKVALTEKKVLTEE
ncbi:hypothetical protein C817_03607 [Dorea sp. 5-2]|nr:hypothetical protein C817_03607 [Dorea sp. 5-2]